MNLWFTNLFPYLFVILFHLHTPKRQYPSTRIDSQTPVDKNKAFGYYHPPNAPFSPVHFTEYPANPDHKPWTLEDLQWYTRPNAPKEPYQIFCDSKAITIYPLIFNRKYNNPAAYLVPMELSPTPKPTILIPPLLILLARVVNSWECFTWHSQVPTSGVPYQYLLQLLPHLLELHGTPGILTFTIKDPELNPRQNLLQTARPIGWELNNPLLIDKVVASPPGGKPLVVLQDFSSKPPVQNAGNFPKVPTPDTGSLLNEINKSLNENYSKIPQNPGGGTELEEAPNTQIDKQKDLKSSHPKATSGKLPVPSATLPSETPMPICLSPENPTR
ncbi:hypothetical protein DSO57_1034252 [Entomophthora muscae]|uniref:Uncharacterized protein n=1 Tax=Entomophthora muscae TaxID=34485 RepID=A0ACC2REQ3_9FUNG|nr:hypothetical protein DSO57_1034252 [Entomophthora muscae]